MSEEESGGGGQPGRGHARDYKRLEAQIGYTFDDPSLLERALTHRSYLSEREGVEEDNQRLEFLGDAVLGLSVADALFRRDREVDEGVLSKRLARLVRRSTLARVAREVDLGEFLRLGKGEELSGGRERESVLADAYEALLAAVYLDGGFEAAKGLVRQLQQELIEEALQARKPTDYKSRLQERTQRDEHIQPEYRIVGESGPAHEKTFVAEVCVGGEQWGVGRGRSKQRAEQSAAREALESLAGEASASGTIE